MLPRALAAALAGLVTLAAASEARAAEREDVALCDAVAVAPLMLNFGAAFFMGAMESGCHTCSNRTTTGEKLVGLLPYSAAFGGALYLGCAPIAHTLHGRPLAGLASFGVRAALPAAAALGTYGVNEAFREGRSFSAQGVLFGLVAIPFAFALAVTTDYVVLTPGPGGLSLAW